MMLSLGLFCVCLPHRPQCLKGRALSLGDARHLAGLATSQRYCRYLAPSPPKNHLITVHSVIAQNT